MLLLEVLLLSVPPDDPPLWRSSREVVTVWLVHASYIASPPATVGLARGVALRFVLSWELKQVKVRFCE